MTKIKFNIKNAQLARVLQSPLARSASDQAKKEAAKKEDEEALKKKPKTRIAQSPASASKQHSAPFNEVVVEEAQEAESVTPIVELPPVEEPVVPASQPFVEKEVPPSPPAPAVVTPPAAATHPKAAAPAQPPFAHAPRPSQHPVKEMRLPHQNQKRKEARTFDARDRQGLRDIENEAWRKRRAFKQKKRVDENVLRPKEISVRLPISVKDLAHEMKLKASQLIAQLFNKGIILTLNDLLDDEMVVQLLGHDLHCEIHIDRSEQERIRITDLTIRQEIAATNREQLVQRSPIVAFMGHVDHGKTSLIDAIRSSNRVASEAGAITQHIGAFAVTTSTGKVTILDTPGHEAFTAMRARGANVTDVIILVVAGDEGIRAQTDEAIRQAKEANVPILVAINKCDKPNFEAEKIYRELSERELLPEAWGGTTITVNCSATTKQGLPELLEMISLQSDILELRANPTSRARGTVLESEMHKGFGAVATVLIQNGTLRHNDAIVFSHSWGRVKAMQNDLGQRVDEAGPATPVKVIGLSELVEAGEEFVVVKSEREARNLAEERAIGRKNALSQQAKLSTLERIMSQQEQGEKKILPLIIRADMQGSLEALETAVRKISTTKVRLEVVNADVGEISESDIELAAASRATILGFHTRIAPHAEAYLTQYPVKILLHDVIYHLIEELKQVMRSLLDKLVEEHDTGAAFVKAVFRSSQLGVIAGCQVSDGVIRRNGGLRQYRGNKEIWKGKIASLKRLKEDVKEVAKGLECGIVLEGQQNIQEGDTFQAYEIRYLEQDL